jgi:hypothetical protein
VLVTSRSILLLLPFLHMSSCLIYLFIFIFIFENMWLKVEGFVGLVKQWWESYLFEVRLVLS